MLANLCFGKFMRTPIARESLSKISSNQNCSVKDCFILSNDLFTWSIDIFNQKNKQA